MFVKFWGTRGSLPRATTHEELIGLLKNLDREASQMGVKTLAEIIKKIESGSLFEPIVHGGDTSCVEVGSKATSIYFDMGSGIRAAGTEALTRGIKEYHIFLTHMHWDHIIGMPFFRPVFTENTIINLYHVHDESPEFVKLNFNGINFPIHWSSLKSTIKFHKISPYQTIKINNLNIVPFSLDHPGHSYGYRIDSNNKSAVIGFDSEYTRISKDDLGTDLKYYQNLDLLIFDGQYCQEQLRQRKGWGHSTPIIGTELALREGIKHVAFTHHDPWSDRTKLKAMQSEAELYKKANLEKYQSIWTKFPDGPNLIYAYDRLLLNLDQLN